MTEVQPFSLASATPEDATPARCHASFPEVLQTHWARQYLEWLLPGDAPTRDNVSLNEEHTLDQSDYKN